MTETADQQEPVSKRIILLSDGTGNSAGQVWRSNVWRVFESLDLRNNDQVAFYDDGVGTSSFKPLAILGGVFGWGLKRNVIDIYRFLCANYKPGDKIYAFGFSRGAFTIRVLMGLILSQGLVRGATGEELYRNAKMAYRAYRAEKFHTIWHYETVFRFLRNVVLWIFGVRYDKAKNQQVDAIEFVGLWDTVAAYGLPIDEMSRGVSQWIWPLELPNRTFDKRIRRACHALSLDDERTTFHPVLWNEEGVPEETLTQVWFAGVHSNVGGGYPDDSLAHIPLYWIMREAQSRGLVFKVIVKDRPGNPDPDMLVHAQWGRDKDGRLYDSRNGLGGYYRYGPRKIADLSHMRFSRRKEDFVENKPPIIHETAISRAVKGAHRYAPIGVPHSYSVLDDAGVQPQANYESPEEATRRCEAQEVVWNQVWRRRFIYFITVFATLYTAIYPLIVSTDSSGEYSTRISIVSSAIRGIGEVLPGALSLWIEAYARDPSHFVVLGALVALLIFLGVRLGNTIEDKMERVWRNADNASISNVEIAFRFAGGALASYAIFHEYFPSHWFAQQFLTDHINGWVKAVLIATILALFTPPWLVLHLRTWRVYRGSIRGIKQYVLPLFFAVTFVGLAGLFGSHLLFSVQDSFGAVCQQSEAIEKASEAKRPNMGLAACPPAVVATCGLEAATPTCGGNRVVSCGEGTATCEVRTNPNCNPANAKCDYRVPVCHVPMPGARAGDPPTRRASGFAICPAACEIRPNKIDLAVTKIDDVLDISSVCKATGIWLEQGQKYKITITAPGPRSAGAWKDGNIPVSTRGMDTSKLTLEQRFWHAVYWPLKRHLFVEPFKVIARVGSTGSDERVLEPDENKKTNNLDVTITPKRSGELFLYVNESVGPFKRWWGSFYEDNVGKATVAVQRPN